MKAVRILTALLICILLLCAAAQAEQAWVKEQIAPSSTKYRGRPKVYQDKVYWTDRRSGDHDIYVWDRDGGERVVLSTPAYEIVEAVYEDKLAFTEYTNGQYDLYLYDPVNGKTAISTAPGDQFEADLHGDLLVWEDRRGAVSQVYKWDPIGGEQIVSPSPYFQSAPRVFNDTIVWEEYNQYTYRHDCYMWNPTDGTKLLSTYIYGMRGPDIYGDTVAMFLPFEPGMYDPDGMWGYKIGQGLIGPLVPRVDAYHLRMSGDTIAWQWTLGSPGPIDVWTSELGVTRLSDSGTRPDVYGTTVAWASGGNAIWIAELVPEPSGLAALMIFGITTLVLCKRKRRG